MTEKNPLTLQVFDQGLQLGREILLLDCYGDRGCVNFVSSPFFRKRAFGLQRKHTKQSAYLTSEDAKEVLAKLHHIPRSAVLGCQFFKSFNLGALTLEVLPTRGPLGSCSLYVKTQDFSLFYLGYDFSSLDFEPDSEISLLCKPATHGLVYSYTPLLPEDHRKQQWQQLLATIESLWSRRLEPILFFCHPLWGATLLENLPKQLACHIWTHPLMDLLQASPRSEKKRIEELPARSLLLWPTHYARRQLPTAAASFRAIHFLDSRESDPRKPVWQPLGSAIPVYCDYLIQNANLVAKIKKIAPSALHFVGPYAKAYATYFKRWFPHSQAHFPHGQPTLF